MEYWGFDRTRCSLRLHALERIAAIGHSNDVARLAAIVPVGRQLAVPEIEVLVGLSRGISKEHAGLSYSEELLSNLKAFLSASLDLVVPTTEQMDSLAKEALLARLEACPAHVVACSLTEALAYLDPKGSEQSFLDFMTRFSEKWDSRDDLEDTHVLATLGALIGFLEGLPKSSASETVFIALFPVLEPLCSPDFQSTAQSRLGGIDGPTLDQQGISVPRIVASVANVAAHYVKRATIQKNLLELVGFSHTQLNQLESSAQFHSDVSPGYLPLLKSASAAHLCVLADAVDRYLVSTDSVFGHVLRALSDPFDDFYSTNSDQGSTDEHDCYAVSVCRLAAISAREDELRLAQVLELLPGFLSGLEPHTAFKAASAYAKDFMRFHRSEASRIKVLYTLTNLLSAEEYAVREAEGEMVALKFVASLLSSLVAIIAALGSPQLASLLVSVLNQKSGEINENVDIQIIETWALLVPHLSLSKVSAGLNVIVQKEVSAKGNTKLLKAVESARVVIARGKLTEEVRHMYLEHLLNQIILKGGMSDSATTRYLFAPLAALATHSPPVQDWSLLESFRNAWFNLAMLGFTVESLKGEDLRNLKIIAAWAPPLVSEESANHVESDLQLNPMLARGASNNVIALQKQSIAKVLGPHGANQKSSVKLLFVAATLLLERLRAQAGGISKMPYYFEDTEFASGEGFALMQFLARNLVSEYIGKAGHGPKFALPALAFELKELLVFSCHRVEVVRRISIEMAQQIIMAIPAALCQHDALFALLDCLTLLDESTKNLEEDGYSPKAVFKAKLSGITLELSDDYVARQRTLRELEDRARIWIAKVGKTMPPDLRSKLFTYLGSPYSGGLGRRMTLDILATDNISDDFMSQFVRLALYNGQKKSVGCPDVLKHMRSAQTVEELNNSFALAAPFISNNDFEALQIARESVRSSFRIFTEPAISAGILFWHRTIRKQVDLRSTIVCEVIEQTIITIKEGKGLFTREHDQPLPLWTEMEYAPSNKKNIDREEAVRTRQFAPHRLLIRGFLRSCLYNSVMLDTIYLPVFTRLCTELLNGLQTKASLHSLARELRLDILCFGFELLTFVNIIKPVHVLAKTHAAQLQEAAIRAGLSWYTQPVPQFPFGSSLQHQATTIRLLNQVGAYLASIHRANNQAKLLEQFVVNEHARLAVWLEPLASPHSIAGSITNSPHAVTPRPFGVADVQVAWEVNPHLAVHMMRWQLDGSGPELLLSELMESHLLAVYDCAEALYYYLDNRGNRPLSHVILYWAQVSPIDSINLLSPHYGNNQNLVQFALRSLQSHPIQICFFYVPQIVQQLRHDESGYVEEYILETAKFSQKFAHQIIWNIMANMYIDDDGTIPNTMKPQLDRVLEHMKEEFNEEEKKFYETEFGFFANVTSISGKLKPYIKKSKAEKKVKIDEEMAKIEVPEGVYLPSHPDGTVVDIDRESGKPMQSHAKAPFLAKFKIHVDTEEINDDNVMEVKHQSVDLWQGAIFKVGDDCRQDVLALQVISVFRSIFNFSGLDVYVFPYKVTATAAGRGVIDVLPNSTSRDMLGRETVNGLNQWYHSKHGGPDSIEFQRARLNFVKSMAAYSVISWLIQFKDRHNGNIMYDDDGHCIHIDFGFCFDIVPGGVRFEAAPFKLTKEMVQVMGGSQSAQPYRWFEEQCVRTFLASRVFVDDICRLVIPMLESGLPCFKGDTIRRLRNRFALNRSEAEAAAYMRSLVSKSYESNFTKGYDEFQRLTNGIPY